MEAWGHGGMEAWGHGGMEFFFKTTGYKFRFSGLINKNMAEFRFQDLSIWKESMIFSRQLFLVAGNLRKAGYHSLSDQLFRATLSITNNIAEGSGSISNRDFANFLMISRKSVYECANIVIILEDLKLLATDEKERLVRNLMDLSKKIYFFRKTLLKD